MTIEATIVGVAAGVSLFTLAVTPMNATSIAIQVIHCVSAFVYYIMSATFAMIAFLEAPQERLIVGGLLFLSLAASIGFAFKVGNLQREGGWGGLLKRLSNPHDDARSAHTWQVLATVTVAVCVAFAVAP